MPTIRFHLMGIFFLFVAGFALSPLTAVAGASADSDVDVVRSASEWDYPPFALVRDDGAADGFSVELLRAVARSVGKNIDFTVGPWHEIKRKLIGGRLDALPLVSYSEEREKALDFSAPYMRLHGAIFVRAGDRSIRGEADLAGKEVIVMRGDNAHEYALRNHLTNKLIFTDTYEEALKMLSSGRHDAVLMLQLVGFQLLEKLDIGNVVSINTVQETDIRPAAVPLSGYQQKFCFAVREGDKELLADLNEGLALVVANGTYNDLYDKWFGPLLPQPAVSLKRVFTYVAFILFPLLFIGAILGLWVLKREIEKKTAHLRREIQERKQAERILLESETRFRTLFDVAAIPLCHVDNDGAILGINAKFTEVFGYTPADLVTLDDWWRLAYPDPTYRQWVVETWESAVQRAEETGDSIEPVEYRVTCKDGGVRDVVISGTAFNGQFLATLVDTTDLNTARAERLRMERALRESEIWMRNIFNALKEAVLVVSPERELLNVNRAAEEMFGYTAEELFDRSTDVFHVDHSHYLEFGEQIKAAFDRGVAAEFEFKAKRKSGEIFPTEHTVSLLRDDAGTTLGIVSVIRDISKRKRQEDELRKMVSELERSNRELQQFAYVASHDLQEPLRAIAGFLQLLQKKYGHQLDEKGHHYIERSVKASHRMQTLIQDLLKLSRVNTAGRQFAVADLNGILAQTIEELAPLIQRKHAAITCHKVPKAMVDANQMQSLLQNLIENAIKYTGDGTPAVEIGCEETDEGHRIHVKDNGIGIDPRFHGRIFLVFQRLHTRKEFPGTGIGLALCKKIVERHGGRIWVESEPGKGCAFYFTLPKHRKEIPASGPYG